MEVNRNTCVLKVLRLSADGIDGVAAGDPQIRRCHKGVRRAFVRHIIEDRRFSLRLFCKMVNDGDAPSLPKTAVDQRRAYGLNEGCPFVERHTVEADR